MPTLRNASLVAASLVFVATVARGAAVGEADKLFARGEEAYRYGALNAAVYCFTEAIRLRTGFAKAYYYRAGAYARKRDSDKALADYTEAIRLKPDLAEAYSGRGMIYEKRGDTRRAIADYNEAIRLKPDVAGTYDSRGNAYDNQGDHDKAIADYAEAIRLNPYFVAAYYNRGLAQRRKGEIDKAIADYAEAIRLNPDYVSAYYNRGLAYARKGEVDKAIADYTEVIRLEPDADAYNNRGRAYDRKGDHERAAADYAEAARLKPDHGVRSAPVRVDTYLAVMLMPWLFAAGLAVLVIAAFLHWQRTRHWSLLTLSIGALLAAAGVLAGKITQMLMLLRLHDVPSAEAIKHTTNLIAIWTCLLASGTVVAIVGGIGAIYWAIKLRQRREQMPTTTVHTPPAP